MQGAGYAVKMAFSFPLSSGAADCSLDFGLCGPLLVNGAGFSPLCHRCRPTQPPTELPRPAPPVKILCGSPPSFLLVAPPLSISFQGRERGGGCDRELKMIGLPLLLVANQIPPVPDTTLLVDRSEGLFLEPSTPLTRAVASPEGAGGASKGAKAEQEDYEWTPQTHQVARPSNSPSATLPFPLSLSLGFAPHETNLQKAARIRPNMACDRPVNASRRAFARNRRWTQRRTRQRGRMPGASS